MLKVILFLLLVSTYMCNAQTFNEISQSAGVIHTHVDEHIMGGGVAFFDFNNDGFQDLYITGGEYTDRIFENNQDGTFTEVGASMGIGFTSGVKTVGVTTGDIDNDGFRDVFVTTSEDHNNLLLKNINGTSFVDFSTNLGFTDSSWCTSASFGDADREGLLDLYVGNYVKYYALPFFNYMTSGSLDRLYINQNLSFNEVAISTGIAENGGALTVAFTDFDNDQDVDVMVGNDFGTTYGGNALYANQYPMADFNNIANTSGFYEEINAMGIAVGDYNEDLNLDYYITNMTDNLLHTNSGNQTFTEDANASGTTVGGEVSWGTFFFDFDNDSYLELFLANGGVMTMAIPQVNTLFENQQNGTFTDVTQAAGLTDTLRSRGAAYGDIDNDGDLDFVVVNVSEDSASAKNVSVYLNTTSNSNNWVQFKLVGTQSNRDAFGAHVYLYADGRVWMREVGGGSSYLSQNSSVLHFGLGNISQIDSLHIHWPSGLIEGRGSMPINTINTLTEGGDLSLTENNKGEISVFPNPSRGFLTVQNNSSMPLSSFELITSDGKIVRTGELDAYPLQTLELLNLPRGVYTLQLYFEDGHLLTKRIQLLR